jgi:hypothetical protein
MASTNREMLLCVYGDRVDIGTFTQSRKMEFAGIGKAAWLNFLHPRRFFDVTDDNPFCIISFMALRPRVADHPKQKIPAGHESE